MKTQIKIDNQDFEISHFDPKTDACSYSMQSRKKVWQQDDWMKWMPIIQPHFTIIDCGAHVGSCTMCFGLKARKIYAIEPENNNFNRLLENVKCNKLTAEIIPVQKVITYDSNMLFDLVPAHGNTGCHKFSESSHGKHSGMTLDELTGDPVHLIKMDIEGYEIHALRGATKILENHHPILLIDIHGSTTLDRLRFFLDKYGYVENVDFHILNVSW